MEYKISGNTMPFLTLKMNAGEQVYAQSGSMAWMSPTISFQAKMKGGLLKGFGRMFSGESMFQTIFTADREGELTLTPSMCGSIKAIDLNQCHSIICQKTAFLCAQMSVDQKVVFTKKFSSGLLGGEGFVLQEFSGGGFVFLEVVGELFEKVLEPGESFIVDNGHLVAFEPSVKYNVEMNKGLGNMLFSGEGFTVLRMVGPGKIILQSMTAAGFAQTILPFIPSK